MSSATDHAHRHHPPVFNIAPSGMALTWPSTLLTGTLGNQWPKSLADVICDLFSNSCSNAVPVILSRRSICKPDNEWLDQDCAIIDDEGIFEDISLHLGRKTPGPYPRTFTSALSLMLMLDKTGTPYGKNRMLHHNGKM